MTNTTDDNLSTSLATDQRALEDIVEKLESSNIDLNTAIDDYEAAIKIVKRIKNSLDKSQGRLQQLNNQVASILEDDA